MGGTGVGRNGARSSSAAVQKAIILGARTVGPEDRLPLEVDPLDRHLFSIGKIVFALKHNHPGPNDLRFKENAGLRKIGQVDPEDRPPFYYLSPAVKHSLCPTIPSASINTSAVLVFAPEGRPIA
jgi:hypothetical protein